MIYPEDLEARIGFDQIRERIHRYCLGELGRNHVSAIAFLRKIDSIRNLLACNHETKQILEKGEDFPIRPYDDPSLWIQIASHEGSYLESADLSKIGGALLMIREANDYLRRDPSLIPSLAELALAPSFGKKIIEIIRHKIDDEGRMKDNASPELSRVRRRMKEEEMRARRLAEQIMRHALAQGWCSVGSNPTIRDGRLVIPLVAEYKRRIKGYLVDESATGQTVFLEPAEVMEANNDLRDLGLEERKEVIRLLREITHSIHENLSEIQEGYALLGLLDFYRAKACLSCDLDAGLPMVKDQPVLQWANAKHPLLFLALKNKRPLVPLTISLSTENRFLLVSGPNAGGKSVCLKTVGLVQYMIQCGLLIPIAENSEVGIFDSLFLDIGDQQSIESDLSTYSSHLKNMDHFIRQSTSSTLILLDELGAGTDPNFGGGIAQAVLESLITKKAWGVATTHYYNLKVFASHFPGIRNASMQFDTEKLIPLYQLEIGQPGSSFALEIASKTGFSHKTLDAAKRIIGSELIGVEMLMKQVAEEKIRLSDRGKEVLAREEAAAVTSRSYDELLTRLELQKKEILNKAKSEAFTLLQETNREIEKTIRHIRENKAEQQETRKVRHGLRELEKKVKPTKELPMKSAASSIEEGDKVRMMGGEVTGIVLSLKGNQVIVQFGDLRSTVKADRLVMSDQAVAQQSRSSSVHVSGLSHRQSEFIPLLDIRGKRVDEILPLLTRFMDDAVQFGISDVRILHGKGGGILRKVVREYLKKSKNVSTINDEHADRGGDGITIVGMK